MTPEQALKLLDQAAQEANTSRQGHANLIEAVRVMSEAIKAEESDEPE